MKNIIHPSSFHTKEDAIKYAISNDYDYFLLTKLGLELQYTDLNTTVLVFEWLFSNVIRAESVQINEDIDWLASVISYDLSGKYISSATLALATSLAGFDFELDRFKKLRDYPMFRIFGKLSFNTFKRISSRTDRILPLSYRAELEGGSYDF